MAPTAGVVHGSCESVGVNLPAGRHRARRPVVIFSTDDTVQGVGPGHRPTDRSPIHRPRRRGFSTPLAASRWRRVSRNRFWARCEAVIASSDPPPDQRGRETDAYRSFGVPVPGSPERSCPERRGDSARLPPAALDRPSR